MYPKFMFLYGCLSSLIGVYAHYSVSFDPSRWMTVNPLTRTAAWLCVVHMYYVLTCLQRDYRGYYGFRPRLAPVLPLTPRLVLVGRGLHAAAFLNCSYTLFLVFNREATVALLPAMYLLGAIYGVVHWGLRPENVFNERIMQHGRRDGHAFGSLPGLLKRAVGQAAGNRSKIAMDVWLEEVLRSCETAAAGGRLVNSETPETGEIDCVEFQTHLLDEIESKICLWQYRKRLSDEGFKELRRYIGAVDALQHRSPDQLKWQSAVLSARAVLSLRGKLIRS